MVNLKRKGGDVLNLLEVRKINKTYDKKKVVNDISFEVKKGEIMGIMGPNGAGKTTTIRMIMGITAPDEGLIQYNLDGQGNTIPQEKVGYLPEERGLYKDAKVTDVLLFLSGLKGLDKTIAKERIAVWLEKFDLTEQANAKIEQLSKGMAQKIQFIASVLHKPALIVLDEPFSGLDPVSQDIFKSEIRKLADEGMSILLSSHQMSLVEETCNRIFLIHKGEKVLYGPLQQIKAEYGNYQVHLLAKENVGVDGQAAISMLAESLYVNTFAHDGLRWTFTLKDGIAPAEFLSSISNQVPIEELSVSRVSLHDIFVRVAKGGFDNESNL